MSRLVPARRLFDFAYWLRLPAERARCVRHFFGIAATLAGAKVVLATVGVTLFVSEQGAAGLPFFYMAFAPGAILLSFGLGAIIDRAPKVRLAQIVFAVLLIGAVGLRLLLIVGFEGTGFALLAAATVLEIVVDVVFWVVVASYLDAFELRRATPVLYMGLAIGGAAGGAITRVAAGVLPAPDLLLLLLPLAFLVVVQLQAVANKLEEVPAGHPDLLEPAPGLAGAAQVARLLQRYPLALLIALNALVVTLLYGLSEFLILSIYEARFASESELAEFLSLLFAFMQIVEFGLLYTLTRVLLEHTGPLLRNLVFPLTSLGGLVFLIVSPRLLSAIVVHVNIEAFCNALFLPISNANYVPLPLGFQGRARTLSEGIFYPTGLALAGAVLWSTSPDAALLQAEFAALIFAGLFALLAAGVGLLFVPTMHAHVGAGLISPAKAAAFAMSASPTPRVRALLQSREPELCLLGLALARQLDPDTLEDDLLAVAARPDGTIKPALARLIAAAPGPWAQNFLDRCLAGETEALKLALLVMLIRRAPPKPEQMRRVLHADDPSVVALGQVVANGPGAWRQVQPLIRSSKVSSDLVDAVVGAERSDCTPLLLACLETAEPEQQRRALAMMSARAGPPPADTIDVVRRLTRCRNAAVRAEALALLSRTSPRPAAVRALVAALDDPDDRVRRRAAGGLCQHRDRATALLRHRLGDVWVASIDAVWALARIASPHARRLLAAYIRQLQQDAERTARLLDWLAASPDRGRWSTLELCLRDHQARIVDVVLAALSPTIEPRLARRLRDALRGADQRSRASAFELIAAGRASRVAPGALALLRYLLFEDDARAVRPAQWGSNRRENVLDQAMASMSPWVRRAAALRAAGGSRPPPVPLPASIAGPADRNAAGDRDMELDDQQLERIVALKRIALFRYVPVETMVEVVRSVQARAYLAGEEVIAGGTGWQDLLILERGALSIEQRDGARTLAAPACFGEVALAGEQVSWPRITALEDSRVSFLRAAIFEELCREHPKMALELCRLLARRLREAGGA